MLGDLQDAGQRLHNARGTLTPARCAVKRILSLLYATFRVNRCTLGAPRQGLSLIRRAIHGPGSCLSQSKRKSRTLLLSSTCPRRLVSHLDSVTPGRNVRPWHLRRLTSGSLV